MKKYFLVLAALIFIGAVIALGFFYYASRSSEKEMFPEDNSSSSENTEVVYDQEDLIRLDNPSPGEEIRSPLEISGMARGPWFFEANFLIRLTDDEGKTLGTAIAAAKGDWMTEDFVPWKAILVFDPKEAVEGKLILEKNNPSGLPENDASFEVPIRFSEEKTMAIRAFFGKEGSDDCEKVYPLSRTVTRTRAVERAAIEQLLAGLTDEEKNQGYFTSINEGVALDVLSIQHGVAFVYFDKKLEESVAGSCRVTAIRAQIEETLKQFPTVNEVIISIDGRTEDILQP